MLYHGKELKYYVILSVDCTWKYSITSYLPRRSVRKVMDITEWNDQGDYDYLEGDWSISPKHRKLVGLLTQRQFDNLVDDCQLAIEDVETDGSITVMGWLPALSFESETSWYYDGSIVNAYVTPVIEDETLGDDDWQAIREMMLAKY